MSKGGSRRRRRQSKRGGGDAKFQSQPLELNATGGDVGELALTGGRRIKSKRGGLYGELAAVGLLGTLLAVGSKRSGSKRRGSKRRGTKRRGTKRRGTRRK